MERCQARPKRDTPAQPPAAAKAAPDAKHQAPDLNSPIHLPPIVHGPWNLPLGTPPPAIAPFDEKKAQEHQAAWAKQLGVLVEQTNSLGMPLALIPPGEFDMGTTAEEVARVVAEGKEGKWCFDRMPVEVPRHRVKISKPYYMALYPVTQSEYEKIMGVNPSAFTEKQIDASAFKPPLGPQAEERAKIVKMMMGTDTRRHPVDTVNWDEALEFCRRLSALPAERAAGRTYRLPTEAEWEYACRAGTTTRWFSGDDDVQVLDYAWCNANPRRGMTHPVGENKPNAWGLYDMHGNVNQWCSDWFGADFYKHSPASDPTGPSSGYARVWRGGNWLYPASGCRSAFRLHTEPDGRTAYFGFREALDVPAGSAAAPASLASGAGRRRSGLGGRGAAGPGGCPPPRTDSAGRIGCGRRRRSRPAPVELVAVYGDSRLSHWQNVGRPAYSRDGKLLAAVDARNSLYLWDAATGRRAGDAK